MKLREDISKTTVPAGSMALWWLGQSGFIVKSPAGKTIAIDPYLTNSCKAVGDKYGFNMDRMEPPPLSPADLAGLIELYLLTHTHGDHLDVETLSGYRAVGGVGPYLAPMETAAKLEELGVAPASVVRTWPNHSHELGDLTLRATFAIPLGGDDLTHVGYLVSIKDGPKVYFTGDTAYHEVLAAAVGPHKPDVLVSVINGAFRNLSPAEAARLAKDLNIRQVIPTHHDLFPDNSLPANLLHTNLKFLGIGETFCPLRHGEKHLIKN